MTSYYVGKVYRSKIPEDPNQKRYIVITKTKGSSSYYFEGIDFCYGKINGYMNHLLELYEEVNEKENL